MRQVPKKVNSPSILLVGSGRLAKHLCHYFELEKIAFDKWAREKQNKTKIDPKILNAEVVLLAISDSALGDFIKEHQELLKGKVCLHFSGALQLLGAWGMHPLMTFSNDLYSLETYRAIHFVIERGAPPLTETLPQLSNRYSFLDPEKRAKYHAICVMSGNFSVLLWEYAINNFEREFGLSGEDLIPYLQQTAENLQQFAKTKTNLRKSVLTGPLVRGDFQTIEKHLVALNDDPMKLVYEAFVKTYQHSQKEFVR